MLTNLPIPCDWRHHIYLPWVKTPIYQCLKCLMSAFNQEKTLVGAFSMIAKLQIICCLSPWRGDLSPPGCWWRGRDRSWSPGPDCGGSDGLHCSQSDTRGHHQSGGQWWVSRRAVNGTSSKYSEKAPTLALSLS